jgi:hypothetical protein
MDNCILRHDFNCPHADKVCAYINYDYSDPDTKLVKYLEPGTKAKILSRKFPGVLVEIEDGSQYWVCEWDVHNV